MFVCLFVCLFFFLQRELFLVFGALQPSNFISQNTVINEQMTSIDQKIVYETLSTSIFLKLLLCVERARSERATVAVLIHTGPKIFNFYPLCILIFPTTMKQIFYHKSLHTHCLYKINTDIIPNSDQWAFWLHEVC